MKKKVIFSFFIIVLGILTFMQIINFKNPVMIKEDIEKNYFVLAVGIDKGIENTENVRVTVISEKFSGDSNSLSGNQTKEAGIVSMEGRTIFEAVRNFALFKDKSLFWGHIKYIMINEEVAKENILDYLDFFARDHELRFDTNVLIVKDITAESFIRAGEKIEKFVPDLLDGVFNNIDKLSISEDIKLLDLVKGFNNEYSGVCIPCVTLVFKEKSEVEITSEKSEYVQGSGIFNKADSSNTNLENEENELNEDSSQSKSLIENTMLDALHINLNGFAVFDENKLIGYILDDKARGLNWINSKIKSTIIVLADDKNTKVSLEVINANSKIKINIKDNIPEAEIDITFVSNLSEIMYQEENIFTGDKFDEFVKEQNNIVKQETEKVIQYAKDNDIDILNINDEIYHQYPLKWQEFENNWKEIFKTMKITVNVDSIITRTYHIKDSISSGSGD